MLLRGDRLARLCRAREMLSEVHDPPLTVEEIARAVAMSPFHFSRQFEAVFGVTPHQLRIDRRMDRAKELLASGRASVTEVCMEVGCASVGSFSAAFTRRVGVTPSAYRRRVLVAVPETLARAHRLGCFGLMGALDPAAFRNAESSFREAPAEAIPQARRS